MCALVAGEAPDPRIAENDHAVAVLERFASRRGHVVVVLRRHEERVERLSRETWLGLHALAHDVARAIDVELAPLRIFVCALGSAVKRVNSFPHVHLHVIPLYDGGDGDRPAEVLTWTQGVLVYEDGEGEALAASLARAIAHAR
ncbi:hypothetical protein BH09MYX1_BH09MYX1_59310 [soil metagenome]